MISYLAAWLFVFAVPWQNAVMIPGLGTISRALGLVAIAVTAVAVLFRGGLRRLQPFHIGVLVFISWVALSMYWAITLPEYTFKRTQTYLQLAAMVWVIWESASTRSKLTGLLQAYVLGGYVAALDTILNYRAGQGTANLRYAATGFDPNDLGSLLALGIPTAWYLQATVRSPIVRWVARAYLPIAGTAIMLTGSRGATIATVTALLIVPWTLTRMRLGVRVAAVLAMVTAVVFAIQFVPQASWARLSTTETEISSGTLNNRLVIWKAGLRVYPQRPILGFGPLGFQPAVSQVLGHSEAPHNTFLAILVEEGLIGLLLYLTLLAIVLRGILTLPTLERRYTLVLFATLFVCMSPLGWETSKPGWLTLALLAGCIDRFRQVASPPLIMPPVAPTPVPVPAIRHS